MKNIKLKEGQKLVDKEGNVYLVEKGDSIKCGKDNLLESIGKGELSWINKIEKDLADWREIDLERVETSLGHPILKLSSNKFSLEQLEELLNINYTFGLKGNGLIYKVMTKLKEVWIFSWDFKIDQKWHQIWEAEDNNKTIKEAGQYTFDGEVVDSFYDENKVYKAIEKHIAPIITPLEKEGLLEKGDSLKKIAEEIYDYIIYEKGVEGIPDSIDLRSFIDDYIENDYDFHVYFWEERVLDKIVELYNDAGKFADEYYKSEEYWGENSYIALESSIDTLEIGSNVEKLLDEYGLTEDDLKEFIDTEIDSDDLKFEATYMRAYSDRNTVTIFSSPMGESDYQVQEYLAEAYSNLSRDDADYISGKVDTYISKKGDYVVTNHDYDIVNYYFDMDDVEDKFNDWLKKSGKLNLDITASISTGDEYLIKENAEEKGIEIDWTILNKEIADYELEVVSFLKKSKSYTNVRDEGHDRNDNLAIAFSVVDESLVEDYRDLIDREGFFSFTDSSFAVDKALFKAIDKLISKSQFLHLCDLRIIFY